MTLLPRGSGDSSGVRGPRSMMQPFRSRIESIEHQGISDCGGALQNSWTFVDTSPRQNQSSALTRSPAHGGPEAIGKGSRRTLVGIRRLHIHLRAFAAGQKAGRPFAELCGAEPENFPSAESPGACLNSRRLSISAGAGMMASPGGSCGSSCTERSASSVTAIPR